MDDRSRFAPSAAAPWWDRDVHADRRPILLTRNRILAALRRLFDEDGFVEVDTAILQVSPGNEAHLHGFATKLQTTDGQSSDIFLHTSPEFACKKLLAAGEERLFTLAKVFRNRERGRLHHPEFTLLEWYRAGEPYEALMDDCVSVLKQSAKAAGASAMRSAAGECDPYAIPDRITVAEAFDRHAGIDLLATVEADSTDREALARQLRSAGIRFAADDLWADLFSRVIVERIEPNLGWGRPAILYEYPVAEAALARRSSRDGRVAERFELYACGVELANGFGELTDPEEQRRRFAVEMDEKARVYGERYPIDEDFLAALSAMPEASGIALGLDRLVMLLTGATRIEQVLWAPVVDLRPTTANRGKLPS